MSFASERYTPTKRPSGKFALLGKYGLFKVRENGVLLCKTFDTYAEAVKFIAEKKAEEKAEQTAKKAVKQQLAAKVEKFMADNEITAAMKKEATDSFMTVQRDGKALIQREFHTATGKRAVIEWNCGMTKRSWNCVSLYVDGETIFTSGHIETVVAYIVTH